MIERIAIFEKVSFAEYQKACEACYHQDSIAGLYQEWEKIRLPERATEGSAGYDFFIPRAQLINGFPKVFPTGIRVKIDPGWFLMCCPKSGLGFKYSARLANTVGIIDSDYYYSDNEGHVMAKVSSETSFNLVAGDKFMQGLFLPFGITKDDNAVGIRNGGFGSTGA